MDQLPDRIPGAYAAEYSWVTTAHDPPPADVMARVVAGLHALDSEPSRPCGDVPSPAAGNRDRRGQ